MGKHGDVEELVRIAGVFGPLHARAKLRLLRDIGRREVRSVRRVRALHDVLCFLRAYPDDREVLRAVTWVTGKLRGWLASSGLQADAPPLENSGLPGTVSCYELSLPVLERMRRRLPACFEIDWEELEDQDRLVGALGLLVTSGECQALDDIGMELPEWLAACRRASHRTDLDVLLELFTKAPLDAAARDHIYESCAVPIRYELAAPGTARCELVWQVDRIHYQRQELDRKRRSLAAAARRPFSRMQRVPASTGEELIHLAQRALCARGLEIRTLSYANPQDVTFLACPRGLQIVLIGVVPEYRDPLECHYCCVVLKNGVPVAYGPGTVSFGCCEIGLNLFPEFRGAEIRFIYPQFVRVLHQVLGARYFFLTPYGMGEDNPAAIRTGAFWFYRKLGFQAANPRVEELARREEERMSRDPGHRSSPAMLRRLCHTRAFFDLSNGRVRPLDLGAIGKSLSRFIATVFDGDRQRALRRCVLGTARLLGERHVARLPRGERRAWEMLGPILAMIPGLGTWSARERRGLLRILRAKGAASERGVDRLMCAHARLGEALHALGGGPPGPQP